MSAGSHNDTISDSMLDLRGYRCPAPVVRLETVLRRAKPGARFRVVADDPLAAVDIPFFCLEGGHKAERLPDQGRSCVFLVTRGPKPAQIGA